MKSLYRPKSEQPPGFSDPSGGCAVEKSVYNSFTLVIVYLVKRK